MSRPFQQTPNVSAGRMKLGLVALNEGPDLVRRRVRTQATVRTRRRPSRRWWSTSIRYRARVPMPQLRTSMPWPEGKGMEICKTLPGLQRSGEPTGTGHPSRRPGLDRQGSSYHLRCQAASLRTLCTVGWRQYNLSFDRTVFTACNHR